MFLLAVVLFRLFSSSARRDVFMALHCTQSTLSPPSGPLSPLPPPLSTATTRHHHPLKTTKRGKFLLEWDSRRVCRLFPKLNIAQKVNNFPNHFVFISMHRKKMSFSLFPLSFSVCPPIHLSISLSVVFPISPSLLVCLSIYLSISLSVGLFV